MIAAAQHEQRLMNVQPALEANALLPIPANLAWLLSTTQRCLPLRLLLSRHDLIILRAMP